MIMKLISIGKRICILLALMLIVTCIPTPVKAASRLELTNGSLSLFVGESYVLKATNTKQTVKWSSSNKKIATVDSKGKVTAKKKGYVNITAKVGNLIAICSVNVYNTNEEKYTTFKLTNKIVGDYSDKSQEITYAVIYYGSSLSIGGDAANKNETSLVAVRCGNDFITNTAVWAHNAEYCYASSVISKNVYTFTLKNNETASLTLRAEKANTYLFIYRIYDSSKVRNNMVAKYSLGSSKKKMNLPVWDMNSSDGIEGVVLKEKNITVYNAGNQIEL
jgi:hypothetical protein